MACTTVDEEGSADASYITSDVAADDERASGADTSEGTRTRMT